MAAQRTSFEKLQRDRAKKAKQAAKREKRFDKTTEEDDVLEPLGPVEPGEEISAGDLLKRVEDLHRLFEDKKISFEDFEEQKADLMARISVE
jgi:hypothetical protein